MNPEEITMEPVNHPFEKENHLPNLQIFLGSMLIFRSVLTFFALNGMFPMPIKEPTRFSRASRDLCFTSSSAARWTAFLRYYFLVGLIEFLYTPKK